MTHLAKCSGKSVVCRVYSRLPWKNTAGPVASAAEADAEGTDSWRLGASCIHTLLPVRESA